jgi:hypothetical protein
MEIDMIDPTTEPLGALPVSQDEGEEFSQRIADSVQRQLDYIKGRVPAFGELEVVWRLED